MPKSRKFKTLYVAPIDSGMSLARRIRKKIRKRDRERHAEERTPPTGIMRPELPDDPYDD